MKATVVSHNQNTDHAVTPKLLEWLQDDIIYMVEILLNLWLDHPLKELRCAVESRLQRLFSSLPWLLGLLPPIAQDFIFNTPNLHPATTASLPGLPEDVLSGPLVQPSKRKRRSRRRCPSLSVPLAVDAPRHSQTPGFQIGWLW